MTPETMNSIDTLLASYAGGMLPAPAHMLVESHLQIKSANRQFVSGLEGLVGKALDDVEPCAISNRNERLDAIFAAPEPQFVKSSRPSDAVFPVSLRNFAGFDADEVPWQSKLPGFRECDLGEVDGCHVNLYWIRPGRTIPGHTHEGSELTLVLDGAFTDVTGRYNRGDISIADETVDHRPVAAEERPCICLAVMDGDLRLTGSIGQRLGDLLGT